MLDSPGAATETLPYPTVCGQCGRVEGWPVNANTQADLHRIRVDVHCRACGHGWTHDMPVPLRVEPKKDRRSSPRDDSH